MDELELQRVLNRLCACAMADSCIELDRVQLKDALVSDYKLAGRFLTMEECETLVYAAEDEDGDMEALLTLQGQLPFTNAVLEVEYCGEMHSL